MPDQSVQIGVFTWRNGKTNKVERLGLQFIGTLLFIPKKERELVNYLSHNRQQISKHPKCRNNFSPTLDAFQY